MFLLVEKKSVKQVKESSERQLLETLATVMAVNNLTASSNQFYARGNVQLKQNRVTPDTPIKDFCNRAPPPNLPM